MVQLQGLDPEPGLPLLDPPLEDVGQELEVLRFPEEVGDVGGDGIQEPDQLLLIIQDVPDVVPMILIARALMRLPSRAVTRASFPLVRVIPLFS